MAGTKEDAAMVIELAKWGAMIELGPAIGTLFDEEFDPETAAANDEPVRTVLMFGETVGTLVKNELTRPRPGLGLALGRGDVGQGCPGRGPAAREHRRGAAVRELRGARGAPAA